MSSSTFDDSSEVESWVEWFLLQDGNEFFCEIDRTYIGKYAFFATPAAMALRCSLAFCDDVVLVWSRVTLPLPLPRVPCGRTV